MPQQATSLPDVGGASVFNLETMLRAKALAEFDAAITLPGKKKSTYSFAELHEEKDQVQPFLLPELIPAEAVAMFIGEDGIGKTQICAELCLHVALGIDTFLGLPLTAPRRRALFCATEDSRRKFTNAIMKQAYNLAPRLNPAEVLIDFMEASDFDEFPEFKEEITALFEANDYDLVVVDAFSDVFSLIDGEINSNSHARKLLSYFQHLCNTYKTTLIIIHHAAKTKITAKRALGKIFVEKNDSQGAGAITQKPRTVLALSNDPKTISEDGMSYINYFHVVKANLMGKLYYNSAFELKFDARTLLHKPLRMVSVQDMENANIQELSDAPVQAAEGKPEKKAAPGDFDADVHYYALGKVFHAGDTLARGELIALLSAHYNVGRTKIEQKENGYLAYLLTNNFIEKSKSGQYRYNRPTKEPKFKQITISNDSGNFDDGFDEAAPF